jgi:PST family polysaccharide transporter/lipopolysaccharide exporter
MVQVVLGPKWLPMLPAFNVLLLWGLIRSILATTGPLFQGIGRPFMSTSVQPAQVVLLAAVIYPFTTAWEIVGAAWVTVVAAVIPSLVAVVLAVRVVRAQAREVTRLLGFTLIMRRSCLECL